MQVIPIVIRQMSSGLWVARNDGIRVLDLSTLRYDILVPISHENHVRVNYQAEMLVHNGLFGLVPRSSGPLHRIRSNKNPLCNGVSTLHNFETSVWIFKYDNIQSTVLEKRWCWRNITAEGTILGWSTYWLMSTVHQLN